MTRRSDRLVECPDCARVFNAQVNHGRCPQCGTETTADRGKRPEL